MRRPRRAIVPIETPRLVVRRLSEDDLPAFVAFMTNPEATRLMAFTKEQRTRTGAEEMARLVIGSYDGTHPIHAYAIADRGDDRYRGSVGWSGIGDGVVETFYTVVPAHQRRGIASEAAGALVSALLGEHVAREVRAYTRPENDAAINTALAIGLRDRGGARHRLFGEARLFTAQRHLDN